MKKKRLDDILISQNLASDKNDAFIVVTEGRVFVDGQKAVSPSQLVPAGADIAVCKNDGYVGRGALKLEGAIKDFGLQPQGKICADIGAATGGFTEVLLKYGAKKVYAIDTAKGKLAEKIRKDERVAVMEDTNILYLNALPERVDLATIDVSFTSLRLVLPALEKFLIKGGEVVALFKPQYETLDHDMLKHGIVRDDVAREGLLLDFKRWLENTDWTLDGSIKSPIRGSKGNTEYLLYLRK